jgi:hypothetical protein
MTSERCVQAQLLSAEGRLARALIVVQSFVLRSAVHLTPEPQDLPEYAVLALFRACRIDW